MDYDHNSKPRYTENVEKKMTLKEEYQHKIDLVNKILKKKPKTDTSRQEYEHMRDVYQYRLDAVNRLEKSKEDKLKQDLESELREKGTVTNYEEMLKDMEDGK